MGERDGFVDRPVHCLGQYRPQLVCTDVSLSLTAISRPAIDGAQIHFDGTGMSMQFDTTLHATQPRKSAFSMTADGSPVGIGLVNRGGPSSINLLSLSPVIGNGQTVTVEYTDPTTGDDANAIQDTDGVDAHSFTFTVDNQSSIEVKLIGDPVPGSPRRRR